MYRLVARFRDTSYKVYADGVVYNRGKEVGYKDDRGYILIRTGKKGFTISRNRMVAECFQYFREIPQTLDVHHKDFNRLNDSIGNLQIMTKQEHQDLHKNFKQFRKKIIMDGTMVFDSIADCQRYLGLKRSHIGHCIEGKEGHKTVKGHTFAWYNE